MFQKARADGSVRLDACWHIRVYVTDKDMGLFRRMGIGIVAVTVRNVTEADDVRSKFHVLVKWSMLVGKEKKKAKDCNWFKVTAEIKRANRHHSPNGK